MANTLRNDSFSPDQLLAVELCTNPDIRIACVTGEAGTGKTTVISQCVAELEDHGWIVELCAPTGRAAARIKEATGHSARTCHRLLGYGQPDPNDPDDESIPSRDSIHPIPADFVFVDETSMLSEDLYRAMIGALRKGARIRFFGDIRQLPPINNDEPPFKKLLAKYDTVTLTKNYRSTDGIIQAAQTINRGSVPRANSKVNILNVGKGVGLSIIDKFIEPDMADPKLSQIICPTRVGKLGTDAINAYVQSKINRHPEFVTIEWEDQGEIRKVTVRPGDKILWTKNDYELNLMNGMIGKVIAVEQTTGDIITEFEGRDVHIPTVLQRYDKDGGKTSAYDPRRYIDLAYAITTHKSQGSEFKKVLIILYFTRALSRQNFYTAITRGRDRVTVIAVAGGLKAALANDPAFQPKKD
jgi:exodeoxyribonuclease V alpha subunit